jgi:hypothetical protein
MRARAIATLLVAAAVLSACATTTTRPPVADGTGTAAISATVPLSVTACEPLGAWCVAAGTNPTAMTRSSALEVSRGGHGVWARGAIPALEGVSLLAAGCWASGCLLGGQGPGGAITVIVNPAHRDAAVAGPIHGEAVTSIDCTAPGRCLALVAVATATVVFLTTSSGVRWSRLGVLPTALAAGTSLTCPSSHHCVAVGAGPLGAEAAWSPDGGTTWRLAARPAGLQVLTSASCATRSLWCLATARVSGGAMQLLQSVNGGRTWSLRASKVSTPDAVACLVGCLVGGAGPAGGALELLQPRSGEQLLTLDYVGLPIVAIGCVSTDRCAAVTPASTVSFVP